MDVDAMMSGLVPFLLWEIVFLLVKTSQAGVCALGSQMLVSTGKKLVSTN